VALLQVTSLITELYYDHKFLQDTLHTARPSAHNRKKIETHESKLHFDNEWASCFCCEECNVRLGTNEEVRWSRSDQRKAFFAAWNADIVKREEDRLKRRFLKKHQPQVKILREVANLLGKSTGFDTLVVRRKKSQLPDTVGPTVYTTQKQVQVELDRFQKMAEDDFLKRMQSMFEADGADLYRDEVDIDLMAKDRKYLKLVFEEGQVQFEVLARNDAWDKHLKKEKKQRHRRLVAAARQT
jgi:hypothetical protein